ncbi:hypothetical protein HPULCUR_007652 [Helicostylum pulchrum]|uniref:HMG box domain-containing protein n=1 Tax=Helicostylum pulchrum TaxID=562976 RepID=A0ABP9Y5D0_9FUNG
MVKCKACNSLFAPKPVEQTSSKQSSNNLQQLNFNLEFSDSENEADSVSEDNVAESFTAKSTVDPKPVKDKRFLLEFSDSEDSDNEVPQETTSFTGTKEKISLGRLPESKGGEETNKQKKREFELSSDSDMDYNEDFLTSINKPKEREFEILSDSEVDDNEAFLTSINKKKKRAFNPLSDSEDGDYEEGFLASKNKQTQREFDSKVDNRKASKNKQEKKKAFMPLSDSEEDFLPRKKKRVFMPLSDSEYEDDGDVLSESEYEDDTESVLEAERIKQRYIALFDTEDHSENEASIHNRHKKTVNDDRDLLSNDVETYQQPLMDDSLFSDADDLIEEEIVKKKKKVSRKRIPSSGEEVEEEVYRKGDLDKKRQKLTAVPKIKLDENGNPIRKKRGKYRFAPRPVNKFNPYILFNKEYRRKFKAANPELDNVGINLLVGKAYRELDPVSNIFFTNDNLLY